MTGAVRRAKELIAPPNLKKSFFTRALLPSFRVDLG
jgi:hypothetical protein